MTTGRTKERYNPRPNAGERRFHIELMDMQCAGCHRQRCGVFHHLLSNTPVKRWRRDHEVGLPLCDPCHRDLHSCGDEWSWCMARGFDPVALAVKLRDDAREKGIL
jgi:hypothetical protein